MWGAGGGETTIVVPRRRLARLRITVVVRWINLWGVCGVVTPLMHLIVRM